MQQLDMQQVDPRSSHVHLKLRTCTKMRAQHEAVAAPALRLPHEHARAAIVVTEQQTPTQTLSVLRPPVVRARPVPRQRAMPRTQRSPASKGKGKGKRTPARSWVLPAVLALLSLLGGYAVTAALLDHGVLKLDL
jgi:hypothetical protein